MKAYLVEVHREGSPFPENEIARTWDEAIELVQSALPDYDTGIVLNGPFIEAPDGSMKVRVSEGQMTEPPL